MIRLIKESADAPEAKEKLLSRAWRSGLVEDMLSRTDLDLRMARPEGLPANLGLQEQGYYLSEIQADAILRMSLRNLTGLDQEEIVGDYKNIMAKIIDYLDILAKPERITKSSAKNWKKPKPISATNAAAKSTRSAATLPMKT